MEAEKEKAQMSSQRKVQEVAPAGKKVKIGFDEYRKIAGMIQQCIRDHENKTGEESVQQSFIVNSLIEQLEIQEGGMGTSIERAEQTSNKIMQVVQHMISKENQLIITQDSKTNKNERLLCLNINN